MTTAPKTRADLEKLIAFHAGLRTVEVVNLLDTLQNYGVQCVPVEATKEMLVDAEPAVEDARDLQKTSEGYEDISDFFELANAAYRAMLKASPYANPETKG